MNMQYSPCPIIHRPFIMPGNCICACAFALVHHRWGGALRGPIGILITSKRGGGGVDGNVAMFWPNLMLCLGQLNHKSVIDYRHTHTYNRRHNDSHTTPPFYSVICSRELFFVVEFWEQQPWHIVQAVL